MRPMESESVEYLYPITKGMSNIAAIIQTASKKPSYDAFREDFAAIMEEVERIGKAIHRIERIEAGKARP